MIHALPGMGADRRMFPEPWLALPGLEAHDWPRLGEETSLTDVAHLVCKTYSIQDGDVVIGASLGGMVGCEISKIRKLRALVLVGSARDKSEINKTLAALHHLANLAPVELLKLSAGSFHFTLAQMFSELDPVFLRRACAAIFKWEGLGDSSVPVIRIHGRGDMIIPPPAKADLFLDGGHLISMSHAPECVEFLRSELGKQELGARI